MSDDLDHRWHGAVIDGRDFHFHRRLYERYGVVLAPGDYSAMYKAVTRKRSRPLMKGNDGGAIYAVRVPSSNELVLVAATKTRFRTAYPPRPILIAMALDREATNGRL